MSLTCDFSALEEGIVSSLARWTQSTLDNYWYFSFAVTDLGWVSGARSKEYISWWYSVKDLYAVELFLLIYICRRQNEWHPTSFEFEGSFHLQGSWNTDIWWIVMHVNILQIIWVVDIWLYQQKVVYRTKKISLKWELTVLCQRSWIFVCYRMWFYQVSFQLFPQVMMLLRQSWSQLYCWYWFSECVHHSTW